MVAAPAPEVVQIKCPEKIEVPKAEALIKTVAPQEATPVVTSEPVKPVLPTPTKPNPPAKVAKPQAPQAQTLRLAPLVPPKQRATPQTLPLIYDPMNPPPLQKCSMRRKVISSGKTAFILGYDFSDARDPQIILQFAGEFKEEGQSTFKLKVSRHLIGS